MGGSQGYDEYVPRFLTCVGTKIALVIMCT